MAFSQLPVGGRVELTALGSYRDAGELANVYQFQNVGVNIPTEAALLEDMDGIVSFIYDLIKALYHTAIVWNRFRVKYVGEEFVSGVIDLDTPVIGTASTAIGAAGVAALLFFPTGNSRQQLRKYFGTVSPDNIIPSTGVLGSGALTSLTNLGAAMLEPFEMLNSSWQYGRAVLPGSGFVVPVSASVSVQPAYQRRRKVGVGM